MTWHDRRVRKTHDIKKIGSEIAEIDKTLTESLQQAEKLNPFAVEIRYPGEDDPPSVAEGNANHAIAENVFNAILKRLPKECSPSA